MRKGVITYF